MVHGSHLVVRRKYTLLINRGASSDGQRRNTIYPLIIISIFASFITYILPMATENVGARYFGMIFMPCLSGMCYLLHDTESRHALTF